MQIRRCIAAVLAAAVVVAPGSSAGGVAVLCFEPGGRVSIEGPECVCAAEPGFAGPGNSALRQGLGEGGCGPCIDIPIAIGAADRSPVILRAQNESVQAPSAVHSDASCGVIPEFCDRSSEWLRTPIAPPRAAVSVSLRI